MDIAPAPEPRPKPSASEIASWILAALALFLVLQLRLLAALVGGLAVYELVHILARALPFIRGRKENGKLVAVGILAVLIVAVLTLSIVGVIAFFRSGQASFPALLAKMADVLETSKSQLPSWLADQLPDNVEDLKNQGVEWLREHAGEVQKFGAEIGRVFVHALIGLLLAMLVMESAFGIAGVVAAPIYYAYLKDELSARRLI
jgi:predicted PurR-regulated permease PerM